MGFGGTAYKNVHSTAVSFFPDFNEPCSLSVLPWSNE